MRIMIETSEIQNRADFTFIRYAQCWEDTEVVLDALAIRPGDTCLSIASAGDNSLALLSRGPEKVIAIDLNPAQLYLTELKARAIEHLSYEQVLCLFGYQRSEDEGLAPRYVFDLVSPHLSEAARDFFQSNESAIESGIAGSGKFERYFAIFREILLPLAHCKKTIEDLLRPGKSLMERREFYEKRFMTWRFRLLLSIFFSNTVMGALGRDPSFFKYVDSSLPDFLRGSIEHALVEQDPSQNPYLSYILRGRFGDVLPFWLQKKNYEAIKRNIKRLIIKRASLEDFLMSYPVSARAIDCFNLSDIFEYMSEDSYRQALALIQTRSAKGARLAYWNMLVSRHTEAGYDLAIRARETESRDLYRKNRTFFYTDFVLEEVAA
ncbi:MAG: DUF3419 family protein [Cyanobacteria bacterium HKST-UBA02]|nr:DUF3419 family protein [Cyanobacteria bacterium HKST-UBA02]